MENRDVWYWLVISILGSMILTLVNRDLVLQVMNSNLISGLFLLMIGSVMIPFFITRASNLSKVNALIAGLEIIISKAEVKLRALIRIINRCCLLQQLSDIPDRLEDSSSYLVYSISPGERNYEISIHEKMSVLAKHLDFANSELGEVINGFTAISHQESPNPGGYLHIAVHASKAARTLIFFIYGARHIQTMMLKRRGGKYFDNLQDAGETRVIDVVVKDLNVANFDGFESAIVAIKSDGDVVKLKL